MKILHFSDTHLGYNELDKVGKNGINLREQDFYNAFRYVIDRALEIQPDVIIHSGDFFHRPSPPNRPMIFALEQLGRLAQANIPIVIIAGNHETPRTIYTSPILQAFNTIQGVYPIFQQSYDTFEFGDLVVHGIPHINDPKRLMEELRKAKAVKDKFNIILLHTSIGKKFIMKEYGELVIEKERLSPLDEFDYVALGHWHNFQQIKSLKSAWYSGSTERMSHTEAEQDKVFCTFELKEGQAVEPECHLIPTRDWHYVEINCTDKTADDIKAELVEWAKDNTIKDALISIHFKHIEPVQSILLSRRSILELLTDCVDVQLTRVFAGADADIIALDEFQTGNLDQQMTSFITKNVADTDKAARLSDKVKAYFDLYQSGEYKIR